MRPQEAQPDADRSVFEAVQQGDAYALSELMRRHGRWVKGVIFAALGSMAEVDDVAQQVWVRAWREARQLQDPDRWRPWLCRIARNAALDVHRERKRRRRLFTNVIERNSAVAAAMPATDQQAVLDERGQELYRAIASLSALYREPFVLRHVEGWSYQRIGETLGLPVDTVETRLVRARRLLREKLAGKV